MSVFAAGPEGWALADLVDWIASDNDDADTVTTADRLASLLPVPDDRDFEERPALHAAWTSPKALQKTMAYLWLAGLHVWHEDEQPPGELTPEQDFAALADWARKYAIYIRRTLVDPAEQIHIAEALSTLADVLGQELGERTAEFIVEMVSKARLPVYPLNALFRRVAMTEAGKIKPASFTRVLQVMEPRMREARSKAFDARKFVEYLEPALLLVREHLTGERGFGS